MKRRYVLVAALLMASSQSRLLAQQSDSPILPRAGFGAVVEQAAEALAANETATARRLLRFAHSIVPGDPRVLFYLARTELLVGDTTQALEILELLAIQGAHRDFDADPVFADMRSHPGFDSILKRMHVNAAPIVRSDTAFHLLDPDFLPEGIAYDPEHDVFYIGSLHHGTILRVSRDGTAGELTQVSPEERALVIGLRVDAERRLLWAATLVMDSTAPRFRRGVGGRAALNAFRLDSGRRVIHVPVEEPGPHMLNDLALAPNGDVYVTDSEGGVVYRLRAGSNVLDRLHAEDSFIYPNGITVSRDGSRMYVAHAEGISALDLRERDAPFVQLATAPGIAAVGIDGLYACSTGLLAIQSLLGFQRVVLLELNENGDRLIRQTPLEQHHPAHNSATTGALVDGAFYYIGNANLDRLDGDMNVAPASLSKASIILRLPVPEECFTMPKS